MDQIQKHVQSVCLYDKRLAWSPLMYALIAFLITLIVAVLQGSSAAGAGIVLVGVALLGVGACRATIWSLRLYKSYILIDSREGTLKTYRRGHRLSELPLSAVSGVDFRPGSERPEWSRWATFPQILVATNVANADLHFRVLLRDSDAEKAVSTIATGLENI
jgi:hypothetical protein